MSAHHPVARNHCNRGKITKKTARGNSSKKTIKKDIKPDHQPFILVGEVKRVPIGSRVACFKKAIRIARRKKGGDSDVTVGVEKGAECVFAEGPGADFLLVDI